MRTSKKQRTSEKQGTSKKRRRRILSAAFSVALALLAIAYLVVPWWVQWTNAEHEHQKSTGPKLAAQVQTEPGKEDPAQLAALRAVPGSGEGAPLILTYHDVNPKPSYYAVTPDAFASQMQLLHDAGYHTITTAQLADWLAGKPLPSHPVLLTFDDGLSGVYRYADPILAKYNFHAVAFVITGFLEPSPHYYMSWDEVTALGHNGRWDIESHTDRGHVQVAADAKGTKTPFLTTQEYLSDQHRNETIDEYTKRVTSDLSTSKQALTSHGLPEPKFFAYPFSASTGTKQVTDILRKAVHSDFTAAMLDDSGVGTATTPADLASGNLHRTEISSKTTLPEFVKRVAGGTALDPASAAPFTQPADWTGSNNKPAPLDVHNDRAALDPGPGKWTGRYFARLQTSLWGQYTVNANLGGFGASGDGTSAGIRVLAGDPQQVQLTVSSGEFQVRQGNGETQKLLRQGQLSPANSYPVSIAVTPTKVTVSVNGNTVATVPLSPESGRPPAGGFELTGQREHANSPVPEIEHLTTS